MQTNTSDFPILSFDIPQSGENTCFSPDGILEVRESADKTHNIYHIRSPFYLSLTYNKDGIPDQMDNYFSVAPGKEPMLKSFSDFADAGAAVQTGNSRPHRHDYFEILLVLDGKIIQKIEDKEYLYTAGSCCLINRNIIHTERYIGKCKIMFLAFSNEFLHELLSSGQISLFPDTDIPQQNSVFRFIKENIQTDTQKDYLDFFPTFHNRQSAEKLHDISDRLVRTMFLPSLGSTYMLKGLLCELFSYLGAEEMYHMIPVKLHSGADFLLFSRIRNLLEDTDGRMTRSELEHTLHYSGNYLNTIVKRYTDMCLFDYGMTFCLTKAGQLLTETNISVSAIAEQLKFSNRAHFYKQFKKQFGMTPQEYRNKHSVA